MNQNPRSTSANTDMNTAWLTERGFNKRSISSATCVCYPLLDQYNYSSWPHPCLNWILEQPDKRNQSQKTPKHLTSPPPALPSWLRSPTQTRGYKLNGRPSLLTTTTRVSKANLPALTTTIIQDISLNLPPHPLLASEPRLALLLTPLKGKVSIELWNLRSLPPTRYAAQIPDRSIIFTSFHNPPSEPPHTTLRWP